jgi:hypothetical protein
MWVALATSPPQLRLYDLVSYELLRQVETCHEANIDLLLLVDHNQVWSVSRDRSFAVWK